MTKERFIVVMTALKEKLKARNEFLDMTYEFAAIDSSICCSISSI